MISVSDPNTVLVEIILSESALWCTTYTFCAVSILPCEADYQLELFCF